MTEFTRKERLSGLYEGSATLASRDPDINLNDCIDRTVILTLNDKYAAQPRYRKGVEANVIKLSNKPLN
ncbi:MAG: phage late control D family protein [Gammaproteobacteria bacterium]|nr:phage late control D family protein [Gammaproteobacteria bacterium]MCF6363976.1 phage late control D family protein [Gammaproteobacteria bacterium]